MASNTNLHRKKHLSILFAIATLTATASAQTIISVNFHENNPLEAGDVAGVVAESGWDNISKPDPGDTFSNLDGTTLDLAIGSTGNISGLKTDDDYPGTSHHEMIGHTRRFRDAHTFTFSDLPALGTGEVYDLYVYWVNGSGTDLTVTQTGFTGTATYSITGQTFASMPSTFSSSDYIRSTDTNGTTGGRDVGNYVLFEGLNANDFTLDQSAPTNTDGGMAGFQLVAVPEPSTLGLAALGTVGLMLIRRRRQ